MEATHRNKAVGWEVPKVVMQESTLDFDDGIKKIYYFRQVQMILYVCEEA
jgi:hypothetical protein